MITAPVEAAPAPRIPGERRVWMAGIPVDVISEEEIISLFESTVSADQRIVLANVNLHGIYAALTAPVMMDLLRAPYSVVHIDGAPIVWLAKLLGGVVPRKARNAHIDLIPKMLEICAGRGWPVAIVGATREAAKKNEAALAALAPGLAITAFEGFFDMFDEGPDAKQTRMIEAIQAVRPALLLVGMGMPRQERWIAKVRDRLEVPVIMPVGGFADYFAGRTRTAPRWMGPAGVEWLFRLVHDPRRLGFRYLIEPILLVGWLVVATARGARWGCTRSLPESSKQCAS